MTTFQDLYKELEAHLGIQGRSPDHQEMVSAYNRVKPLPVGYPVKVTDDWCDLFVTYIADRVGLSHQIGRECGVERHRRLMVAKGIWRGKVEPREGDIVCFDWNYDNFCDHIGYVVKVTPREIETIEGNQLNRVQRVTHPKASRSIVGYARPIYDQVLDDTLSMEIDTLAWQVIRGDWSVGRERVKRLRQAGFNPDQVQKRVNKLLADQKK